jgi:threonylcarbamoyladenosine tRNA methylthiotransferase MtaB
MPQLHSRVIKERAEALRLLSERKKKAYAERFVGRELEVLLQKDADGKKGLSRNYLSVFVEDAEGMINNEVRVVITAANGGDLVGRLA